MPHPVEVMGLAIKYLRQFTEYIAKDNKIILRIAGLFIALVLVISSGLVGMAIEKTIFLENIVLRFLGIILLTVSLASSLASKSLRDSVLEVVNAIPDKSSNINLNYAKEKLGKIVGRDVKNLDKDDILRASAETASENAVDGIFAPIFWIFVGIMLWNFSTELPGPLTLAWIFKASSTMDSMIGYKHGRLNWLGTVGAKLDDLLTWIPCRLVLLTLPLTTLSWSKVPKIIKISFKEGSQDNSPNSGISEAIFANCLGIKMGGESTYKNKTVIKPKLAPNAPIADKNSIGLLLNSIIKLELLWSILIGVIIYFLN